MEYDEVLCDENHVHVDIAHKVLPKLPDASELSELAELFKVFGDVTRMRLLFALNESEMCVCDLAKVLEVTQSAVSHQLRYLKQFRLVKSRRDGKTIYYSLADEHVRSIIDTGREHIEER